MKYFTVENSKEAKQTIEQIHSTKDDVFVFAYDSERSDTITEHTDAKSMTVGTDQELALTLLDELKKGKLVICKR